MPVELALAHYAACDKLRLPEAVVVQDGERSGDNIGNALLVAGARAGSTQDVSPWAFVGSFSRMGRRIYQGGSAQYVKLGPKTLQIEHIRNPPFALPYYRVAHGGFCARRFVARGSRFTT